MIDKEQARPAAGFGTELSARLRHLAEPVEILARAAEALGRQLGANRVGYAEVDPTGETLVVARDWNDGTIPTVTGRHPLQAFGEEVIASHKRGETWVMSDALADPRISADQRPVYRALELVAAVTVPLIKSGRLVALLSVHQRLPRTWTAAEVVLVEDVAERTWAAVERARAEAQRGESQALLSAIMDHAPIGMYLKDLEGRYVAANAEMARLFDRPLSQVLGRTAAEMFGPEHAAAIEQRDREVLDSGRMIAVEEHLPGADSYEWTLVMRFPVRTSPDAPARVGGFDIDITPQKRAEAELERSREALYQSEKLTALGSLLAGVSHELNNPLSIIVAQATMLEREAAGTPLAVRSAKIRKAAERSGRIVSTFLARARQKRPERAPVAVNDVIRAALELTDYGLTTAGIGVTTDLAPDVPALSADADQLHQVLVNLVVNAQHALQERPGDRKLTIASRAREGRVEVEVRDNGPGIPAAERRRIFEPFFTTKPEGAGTGVGLSFSQGVVEAHGGSLALLDSAEGAAFLVSLPTGGAPVSGQPSATSDIPEPARATALVIDDEPDIAEALAELLGLEGFSAEWVVGGAEGQRLLERGTYDLVLSDIRMPGIDGPALFAWMEAHRPDLVGRTAFVTGDTLSASAARFLARSGCPFLEKPFTPETLRRLLDDVVEKAA